MARGQWLYIGVLASVALALGEQCPALDGGPKATEMVIAVEPGGSPFEVSFYDQATGDLVHRVVQQATGQDKQYVIRVLGGPLESGRPYLASITPVSDGDLRTRGGGGGAPEPAYVAYKTVQLQDTTPGRQQIGHFNISGTGIAGAFQGDGSRLTNVNADMLDGMDSAAFAPAAHVHSAADITSGKLADARLSANVALLNNSQTFSGEKTFSAAPSFTAAGAPFTVATTTKVANLNADLLDGVNSTAFGRLSASQTWTGENSYTTAPNFLAAGAPFTVADTTKVVGLNADMLDGLDSSEFLMGIPNPLTLTGSQSGGAIITGVNTAEADGSCGLFGESTATSSCTHGVYGRTDGLGAGVYGQTTCPAANSAGVIGRVDSGTGCLPGARTGVWGDSAMGYGVFGTTETGIAVAGDALGYAGVNYGVWGESSSMEGRGVYGCVLSGSGQCYGVYGETWSTEGYGVYGHVDSGVYNAGVLGRSDAENGNGVIAEANIGSGAIAVWGKSSEGNAGCFQGKVVVYGDMYVSGTKTGYVSDIVLNVDDEPLEPGDLVEITGSGDPVLGDIPVILVRKTRTAGSRAVLGPIACALEVEESEKLQAEHPTQGADGGEHAVYRIARAAGSVASDEYAHVVTLGAFKMIKVDASYGAIQPGDLLVSSPNPGYAMRDDDPKVGTVIGKALGGLDWGTGTVPILVQAR